MVSKGKNVDIIGTFLSEQSRMHDLSKYASRMKPADRILETLRDKGPLQIRDLISRFEGSVQDHLDAIGQLEKFGLVEHDKDALGHDVLRLPEE